MMPHSNATPASAENATAYWTAECQREAVRPRVLARGRLSSPSTTCPFFHPCLQPTRSVPGASPTHTRLPSAPQRSKEAPEPSTSVEGCHPRARHRASTQSPPGEPDLGRCGSLHLPPPCS